MPATPGGAVPYQPNHPFDPPTPDPEPSHDPLVPPSDQVPHLETGQVVNTDIGLFLLAPQVWQGVNGQVVERAIARVLLTVESNTGPEALMALTAAMAGIVEHEYPLHTWNAVVYDMQLQLQSLLARRATTLIATDNTTPETPETTEVDQ